MLKIWTEESKNDEEGHVYLILKKSDDDGDIYLTAVNKHGKDLDKDYNTDIIRFSHEKNIICILDNLSEKIPLNKDIIGKPLVYDRYEMVRVKEALDLTNHSSLGIPLQILEEVKKHFEEHEK
jgi:hypothetical protein